MDEAGLNSINSVAVKCAKALADGDGKLATSLWDAAENTIASVTSGVNLYNILKWNDDTFSFSHRSGSSRLLSVIISHGFCSHPLGAYEVILRIQSVHPSVCPVPTINSKTENHTTFKPPGKSFSIFKGP